MQDEYCTKPSQFPYSITLKNGVPYIDELRTEQQFCFQHKVSLEISPFVILLMLEVLCCRHVDPTRKQAALDDLQMLVHIDQIHLTLKDIH